MARPRKTTSPTILPGRSAREVEAEAALVPVALAGHGDEENLHSLSRKDLAALLNGSVCGKITSPQTISNWMANGCPHTGNGLGQRFDLVCVAAWLTRERKRYRVDSVMFNELRKDPEGGLKSKKIEAEIEKLKLHNERLAGDLVSIAQLQSEWQLISATLQDRLMAVARPLGDAVMRGVENALAEAARAIGASLAGGKK